MSANRSSSAKRPFWLHQIAEYIVGIALIAVGAQSPTPLWPTLAGALVLVNTAMADGPFGAFRRVSRRAHHVADFVVLAVLIGVCLVPRIDTGVRVVLTLVAFVDAVVVWQSDYRPREKRRHDPGDDPVTAADRAERIGRRAGRVAGATAARARDASRRRSDQRKGSA